MDSLPADVNVYLTDNDKTCVAEEQVCHLGEKTIVKLCHQCNATMALSKKVCPECGALQGYGQPDSPIMLQGRVYAGPEPQVVEEKQLKKCPNCNEMVHVKAWSCKHCGYEFPKSKRPRQQVCVYAGPEQMQRR